MLYYRYTTLQVFICLLLVTVARSPAKWCSLHVTTSTPTVVMGRKRKICRIQYIRVSLVSHPNTAGHFPTHPLQPMSSGTSVLSPDYFDNPLDESRQGLVCMFVGFISFICWLSWRMVLQQECRPSSVLKWGVVSWLMWFWVSGCLKRWCWWK